MNTLTPARDSGTLPSAHVEKEKPRGCRLTLGRLKYPVETQIVLSRKGESSPVTKERVVVHRDGRHLRIQPTPGSGDDYRISSRCPLVVYGKGLVPERISATNHMESHLGIWIAPAPYIMRATTPLTNQPWSPTAWKALANISMRQHEVWVEANISKFYLLPNVEMKR